jgi:hypothetical protein
MGMSIEDARRLGIEHLHPEGGSSKKKESKYRAVPTVFRGVRYDSIAEAKRAQVNDLWRQSKPGRLVLEQPKFRLGVPENVYIADFLLFDPSEGIHAEDVKGARTAKFNRDMKLWIAYGPCDLWIISGANTEIVVPIKERANGH